MHISKAPQNPTLRYRGTVVALFHSAL